MFDSHTHTTWSPDAHCPPEALCERAVQAGLFAVTITDHMDVSSYISRDGFFAIRGSNRDALALKEQYAGRLQVLSGVEIGEGFWHPDYTKRLLNAFSFDAVLGSIHTVRYGKVPIPYSRIDFGAQTENDIDAFLVQYFKDVLYMVLHDDIDIVTHLTCPLRYINGIYGRQIEDMRYIDAIEEILKAVISRGLALELNTSGIGTPWHTFMPQKHILECYRALGGELVTLGSDSHHPQKVGCGLLEGQALLQACGFSGYHYFSQRTPIFVTFESTLNKGKEQ